MATEDRPVDAMFRLRSFAKGQTVYDLSAHIWQILVPWVTWRMKDEPLAPGLIGYGRLAEELGREKGEGRLLSRPLDAIRDLCRENGIPALSIVVVNRETGTAGRNATISVHDSFDKEVAAVLHHDWRRYRVPTVEQLRAAHEAGSKHSKERT